MIKNPKNKAEKGREYEKILGINIISSSTNTLLTRVNKYLSHNTRFSVVTPNPELILMAQKNNDLMTALNAADLPVPDGVGLSYASRFLYGRGLKIIPGRVLFMELVKNIAAKNGKVFFLGGMGDEAAGAAAALRYQLSGLKIESDRGPVLNIKGDPKTDADGKAELTSIEKINKFRPDMLFVAFGNPKQEVWVHKNLAKLKVGGAMAVGGTLRYVAGLSKLPPRFMESLGLEWLWRLFTEPKRAGRIFNAVVAFPLKVFISKFFE